MRNLRVCRLKYSASQLASYRATTKKDNVGNFRLVLLDGSDSSLNEMRSKQVLLYHTSNNGDLTLLKSTDDLIPTQFATSLSSWRKNNCICEIRQDPDQLCHERSHTKYNEIILSYPIHCIREKLGFWLSSSRLNYFVTIAMPRPSNISNATACECKSNSYRLAIISKLSTMKEAVLDHPS